MIGTDWLSDRAIHAIGAMLFHSIWQGLAIAALIALVRSVVRTPRARYAAECCGLFLLPVAALFTVSMTVGGAAIPEASHHSRTAVVVSEAASVEAMSRDALQQVMIAGYATLDSAREATLTGVVAPYSREIVMGWLLGVLVLSIRLAGGAVICFRLKHSSTRALPHDWQARFDAIRHRLRVDEGVRAVLSTVAAVPMVVGVFRPVVLVPVSSMIGLSAAQFEAVIAHELAHIRRRDNLVNLVQRVVETVFFYHPAVWWMSRLVDVDREHCCDDTAAETTDARLFASALTTLESLRSPQLAVAATDGHLLTRVRRLVGQDTGRSVSPYAGPLLLAVVLASGFIQGTDATPASDPPVQVDVNPAEPNYGTSLAACLNPLMEVAGRPEWTMARLQGVMGHAFHFEMRKGAGTVYHDAPDWWFAMNYFDELGTFKTFSVNKKDEDVDLPAVKREARDSILVGLARGIPAVMWSPMSLEQKKQGLGGVCWGLIVGYDEAEETYTVRHPWVKEQYTVRYDMIGHADPVEWFSVRILKEVKPDTDRALYLESLRNAVAFAEGTQYSDATFKDSKGKQHKPYGFAAYETWKAAFESGEKLGREPDRQRWNAVMLRNKRTAARDYLKEMVKELPEAGDHLEAGANYYDEELAVVAELLALLDGARRQETFSPEQRTEAGRLIGEALAVEKRAVGEIRKAVEVLQAR